MEVKSKKSLKIPKR